MDADKKKSVLKAGEGAIGGCDREQAKAVSHMAAIEFALMISGNFNDEYAAKRGRIETIVKEAIRQCIDIAEDPNMAIRTTLVAATLYLFKLHYSKACKEALARTCKEVDEQV